MMEAGDQQTPGMVSKSPQFDFKWLDGWPVSEHKTQIETALWSPDLDLSPEERGQLWIRLSRADAMQSKAPQLYYKLITFESPASKEIAADIKRSFPNAEISEGINNPEKLVQLQNVLSAYSVFDNKVPYCQGFNFLVAMLLMYMDQENAFWVLASMMSFYGIGDLYRNDRPTLSQYLDVFHRLLGIHNKDAADYLDKLDFTPHLYVTEWFTTLFVYRLPQKACLRIWDLFFLHGQEVLFRIGLSLLSSPPLMCASFFTTPMEKMMTFMRNALLQTDINTVLETAYLISLPRAVCRWLSHDGIFLENNKLFIPTKVDEVQEIEEFHKNCVIS
eukprot:TRINITY_DN10794_c0_g1_i1.p1 TRINITY_DN10794_c0_g1~~TRINITY_DN10794_c0_g1_i1.p1  ORF type:complete len:332 (-),score=14.12 TRINITY_DN10794_c0_g1_i1:189-1184(-)